MELDKLKETWSMLEKKLEQNEILNKRIVKEMIVQRAETSWERIRKYEVCGITVILIAILVMAYIFPRTTLTLFTMLSIIIGLVVTLLYSIWKYFHFFKKETNYNNIVELQHTVSRYRRMILKESYLSVLLVILLFAIMIVENRLYNYVFPMVALSVTAILTPILTWLFYKMNYAKFFKEQAKCIEELKEFEEE